MKAPPIPKNGEEDWFLTPLSPRPGSRGIVKQGARSGGAGNRTLAMLLAKQMSAPNTHPRKAPRLSGASSRRVLRRRSRAALWSPTTNPRTVQRLNEAAGGSSETTWPSSISLPSPLRRPFVANQFISPSYASRNFANAAIASPLFRSFVASAAF